MEAHPTDQVLQAFGVGELDHASAKAVSEHLDGCSDCLRRFAGLSSDDILGRIREANYSGGSAPGETNPEGAAGDFARAAPRAARPAGTVPAELANHPDYQIIRPLGSGGMGLVYLAQNRIMGRNEVLKLIGPEIIDRSGVRDRFLREIRAVAQLRHPNIVMAYSAFRAGEGVVF